MFCYQQNFFTPTREVTREQFWALVRAPYTKELISGIRRAKAAGDDAEAARLKKKLPAFIFQATFDETTSKKGLTGRWRKQAATRLTGLVVMDIDHVENPKALFDSWCLLKDNRALLKDNKDSSNDNFDNNGQQRTTGCAEGQEKVVNSCPQLSELFSKEKAELSSTILLVYITPSGHGLKVVFKADAEKGNLIDNQHWMARELGVTVDESCKDASRMSFICCDEDILYINEKELFEYENQEFAEKYGRQYRRGNSQPTLFDGEDCNGANSAGDAGGDGADGDDHEATGAAAEVGGAADGGACDGRGADAGLATPLTYDGRTVTLGALLTAYYGDRQPGAAEQGGNGMSRHTESLKWAYDLLVMTGRNKQRTEELLRHIPWVAAIVAERAEPVDQTVSDADVRVHEQEKKYGANVKVSKRMMEALNLTSADSEGGEAGSPAGGKDEDVPLEQWGREIEVLQGLFPCLAEACYGLSVAGFPAALFVSAAFMGTLMTRCTYHFYHRPEETRRLNYCVMVIGDPACGKSFATRLYKLLAAPLIAADKVSNDAINRYKRELKLRGTSSKEQKKDGLKPPEVIVRIHGPRTANGVFIEDMNRAVEVVEGEPLHLHMLTFDSELDSSTTASKGGQWIDKGTLELKAFHNEEDNQQYRNVDSVSGPFDVYWNYIYTGTQLSLGRKVTERNFGSGLATRLGVVPMPGTEYKMMPLSRKTTINLEADETLKTWAFRLDSVSGELPLWPLVERCWEWANDRMEIAAFNQDKADELLLKRVPYYGIAIAAPYILMRHWQEWQEKKDFQIDDVDLRLCSLCLDIQYRCQQHFFGQYARAYFDNMTRDQEAMRQRRSRYDQCYEQLPQEFTLEDVERVYGIDRGKSYQTIRRLKDCGSVEKADKGKFKKLKNTLL